MKSDMRPGILKTAVSSSSPLGSESPAGLAASSPGVGGSIDSNLGIVGSSLMETFRMSCTDCNRSVLDSAEGKKNQNGPNVQTLRKLQKWKCCSITEVIEELMQFLLKAMPTFRRCLACRASLMTITKAAWSRSARSSLY